MEKESLLFWKVVWRAELRREVRHTKLRNAEVVLTILSASLEITQVVFPFSLENTISVL